MSTATLVLISGCLGIVTVVLYGLTAFLIEGLVFDWLWGAGMLVFSSVLVAIGGPNGA